VEAVQASGLSNQDVAARARLNTALSAIDSTPSPLHFPDLKVTGSPTQALSTKNLTAGLKSWIAGLPADETAKRVAAFVWEEHGAGAAAIHVRRFSRVHVMTPPAEPKKSADFNVSEAVDQDSSPSRAPATLP